MQSTSWKSIGLLGALILMLGQTACQKKESSQNSDNSSAIIVAVDSAGALDPIANVNAVPGGVYNAWGFSFPKSINVWLESNSFADQIMSLMFQSLVELNSVNDSVMGNLADTWKISEDKKTFTFHIDTRAKWSDGKPVTAEDVQFYYDVMMNPKNLTSVYRVGLSRFDRPEVVDAQTIRIKANQVHWKNFWEAGGLIAFPKHIWEKMDFNQINFDFPVVNGPYILGEVKKERSITIKRRSDWWGFAKKYNRFKYNFASIHFKFMEDQVKVLEAFKKGDFDIFPVYTAKIWADQTDFDQIKKGWVIKQRIFNHEPIGFQGFALNLRRPLFQDRNVREALCFLINRELMNEKLMHNEYFLLNSYSPDLFPNNSNPDSPLRHYNPEKARALLAEAGWKVGGDGILAKGGKKFSLTIPTQSVDLRHLNVYLEDLKKVGIDAKIEQLSNSTLVKRIDNHDFDMYWAAWGSGRLRDPETNWHSKTADEVATNNYPGVKDKAIDSLIELQKSEMDLGKRNEILKQIDNRLDKVIPYVLLWQIDHKRILYWNKFGIPKNGLDKFGGEEKIITYWYKDTVKEKTLAEAMQSDKSLPLEPMDVHFH